MTDVTDDAIPTEPDRRTASVPRSIWFLLAFVVLSLLALVVVPVYHGRQIAAVENQLATVLEPARNLSGRLKVAQAEQMASLQAFLLSGEGRFRQRYRSARERERVVYDSLYALTGEMELSVRERMLRLWSQSARWHVHHIPLMSESVDGGQVRTLLPEEQRLYDELVVASDRLQEEIARETAQARRRTERARTRQIWITAGLVGLALAATGAVGFLGWKTATLFRLGERRRREAVAARREIDAVLAATGDGVMGIDLEGRCTFVNGAGAELLGMPSRRLLGRRVHGLVHHSRPDGDPYPPDECPVLESLETGREIRRNDEVLWRPDGSSFPVRMTVRPMVDGRSVNGVVLTFADLTEIRETERALRQAVRAREEVVGVVSHDLRNPLATVASAAELLLELDFPEEKRNEHLRAIARSAERMRSLVGDLLDVNRIEAGGLAVDPRPVPARDLLDDAAEVARDLVGDRDLEVKRRVDGELPEVRADRDRVRQVFSNLVGNAVRFTPPGGRITLRARREGHTVVCGVDDTGPGIPEEEREHLFDRFWKRDRSEREGAGLGLAIVQGIVEAHGGRVWVESQPGEGARFRFTLTVASEPGRRGGRRLAEAEREA